jgi:porin
MTAAYTAPVAPGIRAGIGLGYTDHPSPVIYTPETGRALNILANVITYW